MNTLKRIFCAFIVAATVLCTLASCGGTANVIYCENESGKTVAAMNENMFSYHLSDNKTYYLYGLGATGDSADFWNRQANEDGRTIGDMALESVVEKAKEIVASSYMFDELKKDNEVLVQAETEIEKQVDSLVEQLVTARGSKSSLESYLSQFGVDIKNLREYYTMYFRMAALQGSFGATEEEKKEYFAENYSIVKHILINTTFKVKDDGSRVSLTEDEKNAQLARAQALSVRLSAGEDFDELWALPEYQDADAAGAAMYPEGYFVCENSNFTYEFEAAALDMEPGEIRTVNSTYGIHVMKKYPMDAEKYNLYSDVDSALASSVADENFAQALAPYVAKAKVDSELLANYSMVSAPIMS